MKVKIYKKQFKMKYYVSYEYKCLYNDYHCYTLDDFDRTQYIKRFSFISEKSYFKKPTLYQLADVNDFESILLKEYKEYKDCIMGNNIIVDGVKYSIESSETNLDTNECIIYVDKEDYIQPTEEETRIAENKYKELLLDIDKLNCEINNKSKDIDSNIKRKVEKQNNSNLFIKFNNLFK